MPQVDNKTIQINFFPLPFMCIKRWGILRGLLFSCLLVSGRLANRTCRKLTEFAQFGGENYPSLNNV